jgi:hypothetical protein
MTFIVLAFSNQPLLNQVLPDDLTGFALYESNNVISAQVLHDVVWTRNGVSRSRKYNNSQLQR